MPYFHDFQPQYKISCMSLKSNATNHHQYDSFYQPQWGRSNTIDDEHAQRMELQSKKRKNMEKTFEAALDLKTHRTDVALQHLHGTI